MRCWTAWTTWARRSGRSWSSLPPAPNAESFPEALGVMGVLPYRGVDMDKFIYQADQITLGSEITLRGERFKMSNVFDIPIITFFDEARDAALIPTSARQFAFIEGGTELEAQGFSNKIEKQGHDFNNKVATVNNKLDTLTCDLNSKLHTLTGEIQDLHQLLRGEAMSTTIRSAINSLAQGLSRKMENIREQGHDFNNKLATFDNKLATLTCDFNSKLHTLTGEIQNLHKLLKGEAAGGSPVEANESGAAPASSSAQPSHSPSADACTGNKAKPISTNISRSVASGDDPSAAGAERGAAAHPTAAAKKVAGEADGGDGGSFEADVCGESSQQIASACDAGSTGMVAAAPSSEPLPQSLPVVDERAANADSGVAEVAALSAGSDSDLDCDFSPVVPTTPKPAWERT